MTSQDVSSYSLNRSMNPTRSLPNLMSKPSTKQKRFGTPIKTRGRPLGTTAKMLEDCEGEAEAEDDELIKNLQKEIEELREKRLNHEFFKKNTLEDEDEEDNFETAFFAETLLGELGSSSGSHGKAFKNDDDQEDNDNDVLEGDSGASDQGNSARQH